LSEGADDSSYGMTDNENNNLQNTHKPSM